LGQDVADQFAATGYIAVESNLLSGMGPDGKALKGFQSNDAMQEIMP